MKNLTFVLLGTTLIGICLLFTACSKIGEPGLLIENGGSDRQFGEDSTQLDKQEESDVSTLANDSGDYFNGIIMREDSRIHINWTVEDNVGTVGNFYADINDIKELPEEIVNISFSNLTVSSFAFMENFENLAIVDISSCNLPPDGVLPKMNNLSEIVISFCNVGTLAIVENNNQIKILRIMYDQIESLETLDSFTDLTSLSLIGNNVPSLDLSAISHLTNLEVLDLLDGNTYVESLKPLYNLPKITIRMRGKTYDNLTMEETDFMQDRIIEIDRMHG